MKLQQRNFNKQLKKNFIFEHKPYIAVAVSGGPDSMALIFLLNNWIKLHNGKIIALIVDHKLREESFTEAKKIKNYLSHKNIEAKIFSVRKKNIRKKNMNEARNNRFNKILKYCLKNKIFYLFLGHHLDDNLETFVLRKIAGSNFDGLRCMKNKMLRNKILIARPLLSYKKKDLIEFNNLKNIQFINDPTNINLNYTRTIVRNFLLKNSKYKGQIKYEFNVIEKYFPIYREMIFYFFNKTVIKCEKNKVILKLKDFLVLKKEIQIKIIEIVYNFLTTKKKILRYTKISKAVDSIKLKTINETNLAGMKASKFSNKLMLYK